MRDLVTDLREMGVEPLFFPVDDTRWRIIWSDKTVALDWVSAQCERVHRARLRARHKKRARFRRHKRGLA